MSKKRRQLIKATVDPREPHQLTIVSRVGSTGQIRQWRNRILSVFDLFGSNDMQIRNRRRLSAEIDWKTGSARFGRRLLSFAKQKQKPTNEPTLAQLGLRCSRKISLLNLPPAEWKTNLTVELRYVEFFLEFFSAALTCDTRV